MSAGLAVPEGRFEIRGLEPSANRHGSNCLITSHDLQLLFADGKWRLIVRPIHKAIIRRQMLGLPTCPDLRPKMQQASSEVVRVALNQKPKGYEYRIFGCRHARANQTNDLYACVLQQGKSRSVPEINALEEAMEIILTEEEVRIARYIAKQKVDFSGANNYDSKKRDERSHLEITAQGLSAEMAVAKHLNVYPDLDARYSPYDLIYNGFKINVKSTIADHHDLLIPDYQQSRSDFYILVTGKVPVLNIRGVATSGMIYDERNLVDLGKGVCYRLKQNQLIPFWDWSNA